MTSWYTSMNMEQPPQKPVAKGATGKKKAKKDKPVVVVTPISAESVRQKQLAISKNNKKKKKM